MQLIDSHCHIHSLDYPLNPETVIEDGMKARVVGALVVGTDLDDSIRAVEFAQKHGGFFATIGIHPHEAKAFLNNKQKLAKFADLANRPKVVAVGECGLDLFYNHSPLSAQEELLRFQIDLAKSHNLPLVFHVREAFDQFWPIFDDYRGVRGVVHSFSAGVEELQQIISRGLYVGLNGIMTFTKNELQIKAAKAVPLKRMLLETDAPFLTPAPYRGTICQLKHVRVTAEFLAKLRDEKLSQLADVTTENTRQLFKLTKEND